MHYACDMVLGGGKSYWWDVFWLPAVAGLWIAVEVVTAVSLVDDLGKQGNLSFFFLSLL